MRIHGLAVAIVLLAVQPVIAESDPRIFPYASRTETLDNGLKTIVVPMRGSGLVAYWSLVRTGSRDEYEPGRTGFAHFFEHMMFRGTERFPQDVYNETITRLGADANAYTTDDLTAYHMTVAADDLETVVELESDRFRNLSYSEAVFRTEAGAVYGEYRKNRTSPFFRLYEAIHETAFERHTYGHTTMGYEEDIARMPEMYDYARSFFGRYYRPDNVVLLVVGDVEPERTTELIRRYYGDWEPGYRSPEVQTEPEQRAEREVRVRYDGQSLPILWVAYKVSRFDPDDRQHLASHLLAELAFGETSEIHRDLVLDRQLVEFIQAEVGMNRDPGLFEIIARVKRPEDVDEVLAEIDAAVGRYRERPPDPERLRDLQSRLKYGFLMDLDSPDAVASGLARLVAVTGEIAAVDRLYANFDAVTPSDVRAAAVELLRPERRTVGRLFGSR